MVSNSSYSQLRALIRLLDDPDADVYQNVHGKLVSFGKHVLPLLETEWESNHQQAIQERIEIIIEEIEFEACSKALSEWKTSGANDLFLGVLTASTFQYPEIDSANVFSSIELFRKDIWIELNENLTSLEKVRVINHILYDVHHLKPFQKFHSSYQSYFVHNLIENKNGSPMAMAILYKCLADLLELPIVAINLPHHFILGYRDVHNDTKHEMLFYINPYSNGAVFGRGELERYIEKADISMHFSELKPMSSTQVVIRMLNEMKTCYQRLAKYQKLDQINKLIQVLKSSNK